MASYPPGVPPVPPPVPPPGYDPRDQRRYYRDQARAQRDAFRAQRQQMRYQMRSLRRGSVLGPIVLISVGIVFLLIQTGHIDHQQFMGWYGHWWPLLLVVAGIVVLAEWALDQFLMRDPQRTPYRRSFGGGVLTLIILMCVAGAAFGRFHDGGRDFLGHAFMNMDNMDQLLGDKHESDQAVDQAFAAGGSLSVANPRGDVTVNGTSDDGRIHVSVHKQVYSHSDSDADSKAQQFSPDVTTSGSVISVTMPTIEGARGDLVITVPATAVATVTANRGDVHVASIKGPVTATANHGDIELSAISGQATAHINNSGSSISAHSIEGGISIEGRGQDLTLSDITGPVTMSGEFFGTTHLQHIRGTIHFHTSRTDLQFARLDGETEISSSGISADQVVGPVVLTTSNRDVNLDRIAGDIAVTNRNGGINLIAAPTLGTITLEDRNGSIKATLPEHAGFSVDAGTSNGDIDTDFELNTRSNDKGKTLSGSAGGGGPLVRITTTNADISVRKGDIQPLPPQPPAPPKITLTPPGAPTVAAPKPHRAPRAPKTAAPTD